MASHYTRFFEFFSDAYALSNSRLLSLFVSILLVHSPWGISCLKLDFAFLSSQLTFGPVLPYTDCFSFPSLFKLGDLFFIFFLFSSFFSFFFTFLHFLIMPLFVSFLTFMTNYLKREDHLVGLIMHTLWSFFMLKTLKCSSSCTS